jgi:hypothetical protein
MANSLSQKTVNKMTSDTKNRTKDAEIDET